MCPSSFIFCFFRASPQRCAACRRRPAVHVGGLGAGLRHVRRGRAGLPRARGPAGARQGAVVAGRGRWAGAGSGMGVRLFYILLPFSDMCVCMCKQVRSLDHYCVQKVETGARITLVTAGEHCLVLLSRLFHFFWFLSLLPSPCILSFLLSEPTHSPPSFKRSASEIFRLENSETLLTLTIVEGGMKNHINEYALSPLTHTTHVQKKNWRPRPLRMWPRSRQTSLSSSRPFPGSMPGSGRRSCVARSWRCWWPSRPCWLRTSMANPAHYEFLMTFEHQNSFFNL
jgi:hypothetical protein